MITQHSSISRTHGNLGDCRVSSKILRGPRQLRHLLWILLLTWKIWDMVALRNVRTATVEGRGQNDKQLAIMKIYKNKMQQRGKEGSGTVRER